MPKSKGIYLVDGYRTPFLKAKGRRGPFSAADLTVPLVKHLLYANQIDFDAADELVLGCVVPSAEEANIARVVSLRVMPKNNKPAWTVQRNCGSGLQAIDAAYQAIQLGQAEMVICGGTDALSHSPILWNEAMTNWLAGMMSAKSFLAKMQCLARFRPGLLKPVFALLKGLIDPTVGLSMGQTAENLANRFDISRQAMDVFAIESHNRLAAAIDEQKLVEVINIFDRKGRCYEEDTGLRRETTEDSLSRLKPFFDKPYGGVTAGNSSQITDGAALVLVASEDAVKRYKLTPKARLCGIEWAALDAAEMGLGPVFAMHKLFLSHNLTTKDITQWEINEAFAAQVLACLNAWHDKVFTKDVLGMSKPYAPINMNRLNTEGGAISIGHPLGATGARLALRMMHKLSSGEKGVASMCIGGGQGGAILMEGV